MLNFLRRKNKKKSHQVSREFADLSEVEKNIIRICKPYTMTGKLRLLTLIRGIEYLTKSGIEGDIIECGVWKGGSMMAAGMMLNELQDIRNLYLYDTFQGMTEPKDIDISVDKISGDSLYKELPDWCKANIDEVKENLKSINYPETQLSFIPGKVENTIPKNKHEKIALLRLDTDWYESTKIELEHLFPKLVIGGILIIDDYGHWEGARKATDEYFAKNGIKIYLNRIDYTCRMGVKVW